MLQRLKPGVIAAIAFGSLYVIAPPLWDAILVSPQQRVELLNRRINDLDKQIKTSPNPSTTDLKEIATLEKGRIDSENTIRTSLFQAVGGLLVFATLYISWLTLKANEAKQVAERFSKAVEQLGNDNIHVRLGGIYALEQIAKDAEEKYYWQVMETLTSYVRVRSPWNKEKAVVIEQEIPSLPIDLQAVMTVLARRKHTYGHHLEPFKLDLREVDLRRLQLTPNANLCGVNLMKANLQQASLREVDLRNTILRESNLQIADLEGANLQRAKLWRAILKQANLREAKLQKASLTEANLQNACLVDAKLQGAILSHGKLQEASLRRANLQGVDFRRAKLQEAFLNKAELQEADFREANLEGTDLIGANLQGAKFKQSYSQGTAEFGAQEAIGLTWEQLDTAASYEGAILPDYLPSRSQQSHTETT